MAFEVRVVNQDDEGLEGLRVCLEFTDLTRGMTDDEYTDLQGSAYFDGYDEGPVRIYVDGRDSGEYYYENGGCVTLTR